MSSVSFIARQDFAVGSSPLSVAVGDFNGDGVQDLAVANFYSNNVSVLLGNGDGSFQAARGFAATNTARGWAMLHGSPDPAFIFEGSVGSVECFAVNQTEVI